MLLLEERTVAEACGGRRKTMELEMLGPVPCIPYKDSQNRTPTLWQSTLDQGAAVPRGGSRRARGDLLRRRAGEGNLGLEAWALFCVEPS